MANDDRDPTRYGRSFADVYDEWYSATFDTPATVEAIARLADGGAVLELGAGTGRLALPLAARGLDVVALDSSAEMLERLRAADPEATVTTVLADMADLGAIAELTGRTFAVIVCACSSILNLPDVDAIGRCLATAAELIAPGGVVVIEAIVPADDVPLATLSPARVVSDAAVFVETRYDPIIQRVDGRHVEVGGGEVRTRPWSVVFVAPDRFDDLAERAGLRRIDRWADWSATPFDESSGTHVSIFATAP